MQKAKIGYLVSGINLATNKYFVQMLAKSHHDSLLIVQFYVCSLTHFVVQEYLQLYKEFCFLMKFQFRCCKQVFRGAISCHFVYGRVVSSRKFKSQKIVCLVRYYWPAHSDLLLSNLHAFFMFTNFGRE